MNFRLLPSLAERREVLPRIAVEVQLVSNHLVNVCCAILMSGEPVFWQWVRQGATTKD